MAEYTVSQKIIGERVLEIVKGTLPKNMKHMANFTDEISLTDLGISSMSKIVLLHRLEEVLKVDLSNSTERIGELVSLKDVLDFVLEIFEGG